MKPWLSIDEQVDKIKARKLILNKNEEKILKQMLENVNYYKLTGYLKSLEIEKDNFSNIKFKELKFLFEFDSILRMLTLHLIEQFEISLKQKISYFISKNESLNYLNESIYSNKSKVFFEEFKNKIENRINSSSKNFMKLAKEKFGHKQIPFWILIETFTFGDISIFYKNLNNQNKAVIAEAFNMENDTLYLEKVIHIANIWRNFCSHNSRIFNSRVRILPPHQPKLYKSTITKRSYAYFMLLMKDIISQINPKYNFEYLTRHLSNIESIKIKETMGFSKEIDFDIFFNL